MWGARGWLGPWLAVVILAGGLVLMRGIQGWREASAQPCPELLVRVADPRFWPVVAPVVEGSSGVWGWLGDASVAGCSRDAVLHLEGSSLAKLRPSLSYSGSRVSRRAAASRLHAEGLVEALWVHQASRVAPEELVAAGPLGWHPQVKPAPAADGSAARPRSAVALQGELLWSRGIPASLGVVGMYGILSLFFTGRRWASRTPDLTVRWWTAHIEPWQVLVAEALRPAVAGVLGAVVTAWALALWMHPPGAGWFPPGSGSISVLWMWGVVALMWGGLASAGLWSWTAGRWAGRDGDLGPPLALAGAWAVVALLLWAQVQDQPALAWIPWVGVPAASVVWEGLGMGPRAGLAAAHLLGAAAMLWLVVQRRRHPGGET